MKGFRLTALSMLALPLVFASALAAQEKAAPACFPQRFAELKKIPDESRTFEQQQEFEQLQRACAEAGAAAVAAQRAKAPAAGKPAAAPTNPAAPEVRPAPPPVASRAPEEERLRHGFWFTGGLGYGSLGRQNYSDRLNGVAVSIALGGTLSQIVQIGGGIHGWTKTENDVTLTVSTATAEVKIYPTHRTRFFLRGGLGGGQVSADLGDFTANSETAAVGVVGVGYDVRLGRITSLTPFFNSVGLQGDGWDMNFVQFGLAISTH